MKHLCKNCAALSIDQESHRNIAEPLQQEQGPITHVLCEYLWANILALKVSAEGTTTTKGCHLCALLLRSLKGPRTMGTAREETALPDGAISLILRTNVGNVEIFARISDYDGYPLTLSIESDEGCRGQEISTEADSNEVLALIQQWCKDCFHKHIICPGTAKEEAWLPDRVIDVGPADGSKEPCLWISQGFAGKYLALTHRWRPQGMSYTTKSNFEERIKFLNISALPPVFQDAIYITRRLGVRYLWIDAVCIVQDSSEDWRRQSSNMMSIYELCWLNISATGSEVDPRCFLKRNSRLSRRARLPTSFSKITSILGGSDEPIYAHLASKFYAKASYDGFLSRRGWVMQERILSPRTVYFGNEEIFWECSTHAASEAALWGQVDDSLWPMVKLRSPNGPPSINRYLPDYSANGFEGHQAPKSDLFMSTHDSVLNDIRAYWNGIVEMFSSLEFTDPLDKLPAIEGLARALHKYHIQGGSFDEEYCEGHWIGDMHRSLLWYPATATECGSLKTQTAPSWSWASYDGEIKLLPDIREDAIWPSTHRFGENNILQYIQVSNPNTATPIEDYGLEPEHSTSIEYHWKVGCMRSATLRIDLHPAHVARSAETGPWLANSLGFPIAHVLLDRALELDKTVIDYLTDSNYTVYCMQTVLRDSKDTLGAQNDNIKIKKDASITVSVSINGLVLIPFTWATRIVFRRIGIFVGRNEGYNESRYFGTVVII